MRGRAQLSSLAVSALLINLIFSSAILFLPGPVTRTAGRDGWISLLMAGAALSGLVALWLALYRRCPGGILEAAELSFGRAGRVLFGLLYAGYFVEVAALVLRETSEMFNLLLTRTPAVFLIGLALAAAAYAAFQGLEVIARLVLTLMPFLIPLLFVILALSMPDNVHWDRLLPLLSDGPLPVVRGATLPLAWGTEMIFLLFILRDVMDREVLGKWLMGSIGAMTMSGASAVAVTVVVFGPEEAGQMVVPIHNLTRMVNLAEFIQRIDALILFAFLSGILAKVSTLLLGAERALREGLGVSTHRSTILTLVSLAAGALAVYQWSSMLDLLTFIQNIFLYLSIALGLLGSVPAAVLAIRDRRGTRRLHV